MTFNSFREGLSVVQQVLAQHSHSVVKSFCESARQLEASLNHLMLDRELPQSSSTMQNDILNLAWSALWKFSATYVGLMRYIASFEEQRVIELLNMQTANSGTHISLVRRMSQLPQPNCMSRQQDINDKCRAILVDWLIEVQDKCGLTRDALFLAVRLVDQFLSLELVPRKTFQLLGIAALFVANRFVQDSPLVATILLKEGAQVAVEIDFLSDCAHKESLSKGDVGRVRLIDDDGDALVDFQDRGEDACWVFKSNFHKLVTADGIPFARQSEIFEIDYCAYICDGAYTTEDIHDCTIKIMKLLSWNLPVPTAMNYLTCYAKVNNCEANQFHFAQYLLEMALLDAEMAHCTASQLASASILLTNELVKRQHPVWPEKMFLCTQQSELMLQGCVEKMRNHLRDSSTGKDCYISVRTKFSQEQYHGVAMLQFDLGANA